MDDQAIWGIDPVHSEIAFKVKYLMITNVKGGFKKFDASIYSSGEKLMTSDIDIRISEILKVHC